MIFQYTSGVPTVLMRDNSINAYISYQTFVVKMPYHSIHIVGCHAKKIYFS